MWLCKVAQERAIVGADIDDQIARVHAHNLSTLPIEIREILAQYPRCPAGIGVLRWKQDARIDDQTKLHEFAAIAVQHQRWIPRLLAGRTADGRHRVHRRQKTQEEDALQIW